MLSYVLNTTKLIIYEEYFFFPFGGEKEKKTLQQ